MKFIMECGEAKYWWPCDCDCLSYMYVCGFVCIYIQGVSGGIVNILGGDSMDYSE